MLKSIRIRNLLSFGPDTPELPLLPLNVLIGPNGSGKSNLIEVIGLLKAAPVGLMEPIRRGGGAVEWGWKGAGDRVPESESEGEITTVTRVRTTEYSIHHLLSFVFTPPAYLLQREEIALDGGEELYASALKDASITADPMGGVVGGKRKFEAKFFDSVLAQIKDPMQYHHLSELELFYSSIRIYADWTFGKASALRYAQRADEVGSILNENLSNLGLVLNRIKQSSKSRKKMLDCLQTLFPGIEDFGINVVSNTVQIYLQENGMTIPATRLSDGTLRYLCLLAILLNPEPPPLICIEEPELGLHPDVMVDLGKLLVEASERMQLIVTTHSTALIDALSDHPEYVVVCERQNNRTTMQRLDADRLENWLKSFSLGNLWQTGEIGGNRW